MAKPNPDRVPASFGEYVVSTGKDMGALYSESVVHMFKSTGRLAPPFDAKDLIAWVKLNHPDLYDEKGKRIK